MKTVDARHYDVFKIEAQAGKDGSQIGDDVARLRLNPFGQRACCFGRVRHLAGDEHKAVHFDGMAEGRDRFRAAWDHVKLHFFDSVPL